MVLIIEISKLSCRRDASFITWSLSSIPHRIGYEVNWSFAACNISLQLSEETWKFK
jgi:hypothetical protein